MHSYTLNPSTARALGACVVLALSTVACVNAPLKSDKLNLAREAVSHATQMGGNDYAPNDMQAARERIDLAQTALNDGNLSHTDALADEALVNARLAEARVQSNKAQQVDMELRKDRRALQIEIQNNQK